MANYWKLLFWDGEWMKVKPQSVPTIKRSMQAGSDFIHTAGRSIAVKNIKDFQETDEPYVDPAALLGAGDVTEEAARAFNEPMLEGEAVVARAVKKVVPRRMWDKHYSNIPAYKMLAEDNGQVVVGMWLPVHAIDYSRVQDCSPEDMRRM